MITGDKHPDATTLKAFALGLLSTRRMSKVEAHLSTCPTCVSAVLSTPEDRLVRMLRRGPLSQSRAGPPRDPDGPPEAGPGSMQV
ncbi:MAG: zf-HC2 domain-containing protein [Isosphaeraceae bacterium]